MQDCKVNVARPEQVPAERSEVRLWSAASSPGQVTSLSSTCNVTTTFGLKPAAQLIQQGQYIYMYVHNHNLVIKNEISSKIMISSMYMSY